MPDDASDLKRLLLELYRSGRPLFDELQWEFESARWKELLAYAVAVNAKLELGFARDLVETLDRLKLTSAAALATISAADLWLVEQIALRAGCDPESARLALDALTGCSKAVNAEHGGLIQRFLRKHGDAMVGELEASLAAAGLPPAAARKTGALWLQNVANIPVLLPQDAYVQSFCAEHDVTPEALVATADELDLNVGLLDDLLALEAAASVESDSPPRGTP